MGGTQESLGSAPAQASAASVTGERWSPFVFFFFFKQCLTLRVRLKVAQRRPERKRMGFQHQGDSLDGRSSDLGTPTPGLKSSVS